ncbi:hypothetical protein [Rudanella lutea]|uniref:hypothetical protein n=1 Tax=Rudanella lutea TaxID=451374 RepID=UPI00037CCC94|nr:hypothetical protein [Rudanella lutea]
MPVQYIEPICHFLNQIGIQTRYETLHGPTFLPGLLIQNGTILIDRDKLLYPGDILHEAGHIAVCLPEDRPNLGGNITDNHPDKAGDEMAVLLWTYAASLHLNLPPDIVFHKDGYNGNSQWLIDHFTTGQYIGLPLLVWMGLAHNPDTNEPGVGFPTMIHWLRP